MGVLGVINLTRRTVGIDFALVAKGRHAQHSLSHVHGVLNARPTPMVPVPFGTSCLEGVAGQCSTPLPNTPAERFWLIASKPFSHLLGFESLFVHLDAIIERLPLGRRLFQGINLGSLRFKPLLVC